MRLSQEVGFSESVKHFQRRLVEDALRESNGNRSEAARLLKMDRSNLRALMKRLGIEA
jgi:transcriptional regulator with GAF, ATPase, and Fis domain